MRNSLTHNVVILFSVLSESVCKYKNNDPFTVPFSFFFNVENLTLHCAFQKTLLQLSWIICVFSCCVSVIFSCSFHSDSNPLVVLIYSCPLLAGEWQCNETDFFQHIFNEENVSHLVTNSFNPIVIFIIWHLTFLCKYLIKTFKKNELAETSCRVFLPVPSFSCYLQPAQ